MRNQVLSFIEGLDLGSFRVSQELPWSEGENPLYLKNLKSLYVGPAQYETETIIAALNGLNIQNQEITVEVSFACDAKKLPADYQLVISQLLNVKNITDIEPSWNREVTHTTEYEGDVLVTQVEFIFTKLLT